MLLLRKLPPSMKRIHQFSILLILKQILINFCQALTKLLLRLEHGGSLTSRPFEEIITDPPTDRQTERFKLHKRNKKKRPTG